MRPRTQETCWAVWNPRLGIYFGSISDTRICAIIEYLKCCGIPLSGWRLCHKNGDRAVKIRVEVVLPKPPRKRRG